MQKNPYPGKFIVIEGLDGSGQSTQAELLKNFLLKEGHKVVLTKEPTQDSEAGKKIKEVLGEAIKLESQLLQELFVEDRKEHLQNLIIPALKEGKMNSEILLGLVNNVPEKITAKEVFQAAREGDILSQKIVDGCIFYTKVGIGLVNNFYDCSTIYFGGAMMKDKEQIIPPIIEQFKNNPIRFTINHPPKIKLTSLGDEVGLRGALALVKYKSEGNYIVS